ncbi:MAG: Flp pilus assembly complex ATPase component TadA [Candidatus Omnitrophica bacterium]|nr:Flp pilus assembly complex ATPase component TadA [Candidatus Omnitrophota bacterium]
MRKSKVKLGELLIKGGYITQEELVHATETQKQEGGRIGEILVRLGVLAEKDIVDALGKQLGIPYLSLTHSVIEPAITQNLREFIPEEFARSHLVVPLSKHLGSMTCAFVDPLDLMTTDNVRRMAKCEVNPVISTKSDVENAINEIYGAHDFLKEAVQSSYSADDSKVEAITIEKEELSLDRLIARAEEAPVVKLVNLLLMQAVKDRASDIHLEPFQSRVVIRFRIDGVLYEIPPPSTALLPALVSRVKILAKLDIAEKRLPQDGGFGIKVDNKLVDLRVSSIPAIYGEKVVIRILDKGAMPENLEDLGFEPAHLALFERAIKRPYGLVFLTGPTGSGKTTTLYAALRRIRTPEKNILTIEDPVEYRLDGVNQVQTKPQIGLTFAAGLRAFLRQDPDIIMVGEVRDLETAEICVKAALTGHLVLSTLHTNDAPSAVTRLVDIGVEPFLVSSAVVLVVAQRLVRRLCENCRESFEPKPELAQKLNLAGHTIYKPRGCPECRNTGYHGRCAIYEMFFVSEALKNVINEKPRAELLRQESKKAGMMTLWESGLEKAKRGITSLEEVAGVTVGD